MDVVVIVPTYNERENLPALVGELVADARLRILVVDDHSPDRTALASGVRSAFGANRGGPPDEWIEQETGNARACRDVPLHALQFRENSPRLADDAGSGRGVADRLSEVEGLVQLVE